MQRMRSMSKKCDWMKIDFSEIRLLLKNHLLEFHEICAVQGQPPK